MAAVRNLRASVGSITFDFEQAERQRSCVTLILPLLGQIAQPSALRLFIIDRAGTSDRTSNGTGVLRVLKLLVHFVALKILMHVLDRVVLRHAAACSPLAK